MKGVVFVAQSGLANRLRALIGCRVLAELRGVPLTVVWESTGACAAPFSELFELSGWDDVRFLDAEERGAADGSDGRVRIGQSLWFSAIWEAHAASLVPREEFDRRSLGHLRSLVPAAAIREPLEAFVAAHDVSDRVGVHIRMTDNVHHYARWEEYDSFDRSKVSSIEGFAALLASLERRGERVLLATDNPDVEREFLARHANVIAYPKRYDLRGHEHHVKTGFGRLARLHARVDRLRAALGSGRPRSWRTTAVADGLADLLLLSRCREIVGTYYSSFSDVAALRGGVPLSIMEGREARPNAFLAGLLAETQTGP